MSKASKSQRRKKNKERYEDSSTSSSSCSAAESEAYQSCDGKEAKECIITGLVKVEGSKCQTPVLFSISDSWEELHKQILTDNICLGKHDVGKHIGDIKHEMSLPSPSSINHFGLSPSSWVKMGGGVFINIVEILQDILPEIKKSEPTVYK